MIHKWLPGLAQLKGYHFGYLTGDVTAGIIVAFLLIPQSMAYAIIAGVPLTIGLFAATFPLIVYALFGGSSYLSVGPVSILSLLAFSGISNIAEPNTPEFLVLMIFLTLIVGVVQLFMGCIKVGSFFAYISPAVISGFTSAAAIIIALTQVKSIMGVSLTDYQNVFSYIVEMAQQLPNINPYTVIIGIVSLILLLIIKRRFLTGPFIVIIVSIFIIDFFNLDQRGVHIVGEIPHEAVAFSLQLPSINTFQLLFPIAFMIGFISFVESYAVAKTIADKERQTLNPNQELFGLGLANITSSLVGAIPVAGAISRTAVNHQSGAKSNLSLFITALFMLLATIYLTPLFYYLPKAALAAIIIIAVSNLINMKQFSYYVKNKPTDAIILLVTLTLTLMVDIFIGLIIGMFFSIAVNLIKESLSFTG